MEIKTKTTIHKFNISFIRRRTSTLDDIFRHIKANGSSGVDFLKSPPFRRIDSGVASTSDENENEYEEGTVSGYAVQHAMPSGFVRPRPENHQNDIQYATNNNNNHQPEQQYTQNVNYQQDPQYFNYQHEHEITAPMPPQQTETIAGNKAGLTTFVELFVQFWHSFLNKEIF